MTDPHHYSSISSQNITVSNSYFGGVKKSKKLVIINHHGVACNYMRDLC